MEFQVPNADHFVISDNDKSLGENLLYYRLREVAGFKSGEYWFTLIKMARFQYDANFGCSEKTLEIYNSIVLELFRNLVAHGDAREGK